MDVDTTTTPTLQDFVKIQMQVVRWIRDGAEARFSHEWNERVRVFVQLLCMDQKDKEGKSPDPDNWEELPDTTVLGSDSLKFFEDLKSWLREQSDQFAGI